MVSTSSKIVERPIEPLRIDPVIANRQTPRVVTNAPAVLNGEKHAALGQVRGDVVRDGDVLVLTASQDERRVIDRVADAVPSDPRDKRGHRQETSASGPSL